MTSMGITAGVVLFNTDGTYASLDDDTNCGSRGPLDIIEELTLSEGVNDTLLACSSSVLFNSQSTVSSGERCLALLAA